MNRVRALLVACLAGLLQACQASPVADVATSAKGEHAGEKGADDVVFYQMPVSTAPGWRHPAFPAEAFQQHIEGRAVVDCEITIEGRTTDCRPVSWSGSHAFLDAYMAWLQRPGLIFKPMTRSGVPTSGRHVFSLAYRYG